MRAPSLGVSEPVLSPPPSLPPSFQLQDQDFAAERTNKEKVWGSLAKFGQKGTKSTPSPVDDDDDEEEEEEEEEDEAGKSSGRGRVRVREGRARKGSGTT